MCLSAIPRMKSGAHLSADVFPVDRRALVPAIIADGITTAVYHHARVADRKFSSLTNIPATNTLPAVVPRASYRQWFLDSAANFFPGKIVQQRQILSPRCQAGPLNRLPWTIDIQVFRKCPRSSNRA